MAIKLNYAPRRDDSGKRPRSPLVRPLDIILGLSIGMALAAFLIF
ncbi:hypothetical protein ATDW_14690 [Asticcacaulis sp. DW145]|uniref:Uncharacterized protein n=1 Tax=Asticcacaulis currens TaxID=2984210 RepID=A0ABT5IEE0_9CAUL|nr:hypothetical protein [Asticcacaulis currens]MDC7694548.1 hypothetical protein [Asticcacaulis currens]BEV10973.1 hypothetical protein ATDW_14690 [Asticcacaulis sp. DW145]